MAENKPSKPILNKTTEFNKDTISKEVLQISVDTLINNQYFQVPENLDIQKIKEIYFYNGKIKQAVDLPVTVSINRIVDYIHPDPKIQEFVKNYVFKRVDYKRIIKNILTARWVGISVSLVELEYVDKYLTVKNIYTIDPEKYMEVNGIGVDKIKFRTSTGEKEVNRKNCIVYIHDAKFSEPYGNSILRYILKHYNDKVEVEGGWKLFLRKYAIPTIIGYISKSKSDAEKDALFQQLVGLAYGAVGLIDREAGGKNALQDEITFVETKKDTADFNAFVTKQDRDILISLGVPPLLFEPTERGTYALGAVQMKILLMTIKDCQDAVRNVFCGQIIEPLVMANFGVSEPGEIIFKELEGRDLLEMTESFAYLIDKGVLSPDDNQIVDNLGFKRADGTYGGSPSSSNSLPTKNTTPPEKNINKNKIIEEKPVKEEVNNARNNG